MNEAMKQRFGLIRRPWGGYYLKNKSTGDQTSLKTRDKDEAQRLLQGYNEAESQPHFTLALARVYMNGADPKLGTRTWQEVMEHILEKKTGETHRRWEVAIKDKNFDCIRNLPVAETRPEHFDKALADAKVSTNVYLRRIHNHALGMDWLLKPVIARLQWPRPVFKPHIFEDSPFAQPLPKDSLFLHSDLVHHAPRCGVPEHVVGVDSVKAQRFESKLDESLGCFGRIPLAPPVYPDPVAHFRLAVLLLYLGHVDIVKTQC